MSKKFTEAAIDLSHVCDIIDEGNEDINEMLVESFSNALEDVAQAVDRRKWFLNEVESKIELARQRRDEASKAMQKFKNIRERVIEATKYVIEAHPNIPFKDSLGKNLKVIKNPMPSLKMTGDWEASPYAKVVKKLELDKERLKEDLLGGGEVEFAKLEYGTQLRGLK